MCCTSMLCSVELTLMPVVAGRSSDVARAEAFTGIGAVRERGEMESRVRVRVYAQLACKWRRGTSRRLVILRCGDEAGAAAGEATGVSLQSTSDELV